MNFFYLHFFCISTSYLSFLFLLFAFAFIFTFCLFSLTTIIIHSLNKTRCFFHNILSLQTNNHIFIFYFIKAELQRQRDTNVSLKNTLSESEIDHKLRLQELETAKIR